MKKKTKKTNIDGLHPPFSIAKQEKSSDDETTAENINNIVIKNKRTKSGFVTEIEGYLTPAKCEPIKLKMSAKRKDWENLIKYFFDDHEMFEYEFAWMLSILLDKTKPKPRGINSETTTLVRSIREQACWLYIVLSYWCKEPRESYPEYIRKIVDMAEDEAKAYGWSGFFQDDTAARYKRESRENAWSVKLLACGSENSGYEPKLLTAYCINKIHGKEIEGRLQPFFSFEDDFNVESFYVTYILSSKGIKKLQKAFVEKRTREEIQSLPFRHPSLRNALEALKVI